MKLIDLDPRWLTFEGRRVGFIFRCPLTTADKRRWWQTCFAEKFYLFKGRDGQYRRAGGHSSCPDSQFGIVKASLLEAVECFQPCNTECQWTIDGGIEAATFETLTVTPSLDGSAGGLWHGFITNGEIVGGI